MPIYAYRCTACGHAQDVLQKMSDPVLTECPACGASAYAKQVTAAGFQLKGSGWYVTDFRGGNNAAAAAKKDGDAAPGKAGDKPSDGAAAPAPASKGTDSAAPAPAPAAPAASGPSPSPASGS